MTAQEDIGIWIEFLLNRRITQAEEDVLRTKLDYWIRQARHQVYSECANNLSQALMQTERREEWIAGALGIMREEATKSALITP